MDGVIHFPSTSIILIGFMGVGKDTVAKILEEATGFPVLGIDKLVEKEKGCTVAEIIDNHGLPFFRTLESGVLVAHIGQRAIISTGGGIIESPENRRAMRCGGRVYWLDAPFEIAKERVKKDTKNVRPLFRDEAAARELLKRREDLYRQCCHKRIDASGAAEDAARLIYEDLPQAA